MDFLEIIIAAFFATSAMTFFSYMVSWIFDKTYKEPVLLEFLMSSFHFKVNQFYREIASWYLHYFIGLLFVIAFNIPLWIYPELYDISFQTCLLFGGIIGIVGIIWWYTMFLFTADATAPYSYGYYLQLFFAHLVFGIAMYAIHWYLN